MKRRKPVSTLLAALLCLVLLASCAQTASSSAAPSPGSADAAPSSTASSAASSASASGDVSQPVPQEAAVEDAFVIERKSRAAETPMGEEGTWTIFIYMCGADLESEGSLASINLWQIMQSIPGDDLNVVVQTGGSRAWGQPVDAGTAEFFGIEGDFSSKVVDPDVLQRYEVTDELTLVDEQPLASMGNQDTLYDFLSWGVENYPAEKMGVIFWNHGGGSLSGVCVDELHDHDILMPFEMSNAFDKLYDEMTDRFEFIGFDACLMSTIEVANLLVPHGRYMYASEETEPGFGWDYTALIDEVNRKPGASGAEVGAVVCDAYFDYLRTLGGESGVTLSVTDLEKVDDVLYALDDLALQLDQGLEDPAYFAEVSRGVSRTEKYYYNYLIDLGDMADKLAEVAPEEAAALRAAVDAAVTSNVSGAARSFASGLSVYYPTTVSAKTIVYYGLSAPTPAYFDYINQIQYRKILLDLSEQHLVNIVQAPALDASDHYAMEIDPATLDYVRDVGFALYVAPEGNESAYYLGYDNDVNADIETGLVQDNFKANWAHLDGEPLMITLQEFNDEYNLYHSPIMLNGERTKLVLQWTWDESEEHNGHYEIIGTYSGGDPFTGMASRQTRSLQAGDSVVPLYGTVPYELVVAEELADPSEYLDENEELILTPGNSILIREDSEVVHGPLEAERYLYQFGVIDVYGEEQTYAPIAFQVDEAGAVTHPEADAAAEAASQAQEQEQEDT